MESVKSAGVARHQPSLKTFSAPEVTVVDSVESSVSLMSARSMTATSASSSSVKEYSAKEGAVASVLAVPLAAVMSMKMCDSPTLPGVRLALTVGSDASGTSTGVPTAAAAASGSFSAVEPPRVSTERKRGWRMARAPVNSMSSISKPSGTVVPLAGVNSTVKGSSCDGPSGLPSPSSSFLSVAGRVSVVLERSPSAGTIRLPVMVAPPKSAASTPVPVIAQSKVSADGRVLPPRFSGTVAVGVRPSTRCVWSPVIVPTPPTAPAIVSVAVSSSTIVTSVVARPPTRTSSGPETLVIVRVNAPSPSITSSLVGSTMTRRVSAPPVSEVAKSSRTEVSPSSAPLPPSDRV